MNTCSVQELLERMKWLQGRLLYIETAAFQAGGRADVPHKVDSSNLFMRLGTTLGGSDLHLVDVDGAIPFSIAVPNIVECAWFDPDPSLLGEQLDRHILYRRLMPLTIVENWRDKFALTFIHVATESILLRPKPDGPQSIRADWGEPWCKRCSETFFWTPGCKEIAYYRHGSAFVCPVCHDIIY